MPEQRPSSAIPGYGVRFQASQAGWRNADNMGAAARVMEGARYDRSGRTSGTYSFPDEPRTTSNGHVLRIIIATFVVVLRRGARARRKSVPHIYGWCSYTPGRYGSFLSPSIRSDADGEQSDR